MDPREDAIAAAPPSPQGESPRELFLRVLLPPHVDHVVPVASDFSLGSDAGNTVQLSMEGVKPFHAQVKPQDGHLFLRCASNSWLRVQNVGDSQVICLLPGVSFLIEAVRFDVIRRSDIASYMTLCEEPPAPCVRCNTPLPSEAAFCRRCGFKRMSAKRSLIRIVEESPGTFLGEANPSRFTHGVHTAVISGYASAMNQLGQKYERGLGVQKNDQEAERCFFKAARLGNEDARTKMTHPDAE